MTTIAYASASSTIFIACPVTVCHQATPGKIFLWNVRVLARTTTQRLASKQHTQREDQQQREGYGLRLVPVALHVGYKLRPAVRTPHGVAIGQCCHCCGRQLLVELRPLTLEGSLERRNDRTAVEGEIDRHPDLRRDKMVRTPLLDPSPPALHAGTHTWTTKSPTRSTK